MVFFSLGKNLLFHSIFREFEFCEKSEVNQLVLTCESVVRQTSEPVSVDLLLVTSQLLTVSWTDQ